MMWETALFRVRFYLGSYGAAAYWDGVNDQLVLVLLFFKVTCSFGVRLF